MHIVADRHEPPERPGESGSVPELKRYAVLWFHSLRNRLGAGGSRGSIPQSQARPIQMSMDEPDVEGK